MYHMDFIIVLPVDGFYLHGDKVSIFLKVATFENLTVFDVGMVALNAIEQIVLHQF